MRATTRPLGSRCGWPAPEVAILASRHQLAEHKCLMFPSGARDRAGICASLAKGFCPVARAQANIRYSSQNCMFLDGLITWDIFTRGAERARF